MLGLGQSVCEQGPLSDLPQTLLAPASKKCVCVGLGLGKSDQGVV